MASLAAASGVRPREPSTRKKGSGGERGWATGRTAWSASRGSVQSGLGRCRSSHPRQLEGCSATWRMIPAWASLSRGRGSHWPHTTHRHTPSSTASTAGSRRK